ncbi:MAG: alpha-2-macroglobulin family protein [Alphaproteobacteria bacterium]|nr:alpha-2-macroglobulin family protein [Alphaproteobacteria bacterium]
MVFRLFLIVFFLSFTQIKAEIIFPSWTLSQSEEYIKGLKEKGSSLSKEDALLSRNRAKEAIKKNEWQLAIAELEICAGYDLKDIETLLELAFIHYQLSKKGQDTWKLRNAMDKLIPHILKNATSVDDKAKALLLYAASHNESGAYFKELTSLIDITEFRKKYPDYAELYLFTYQSFRVNQNAAPPSVCFNFSHPIDPAITNLKDYFEITPKVDGEVRLATDQEVCITGIEFGKSYDVIIKEGIKSKYGEKITKTEKVGFIVENQSPRLAFSDRSILVKDEAQLVPLTAINISKVNLEVIRISDRSFVENLVRRYGAIDSGLYEYSLSKIKKETGEEIYKGTLEIGGAANQSITKQIPFKDIAKETKPGIYGIYAQEEGSLNHPASAYQWLLVTDLGITTFKGESGLDVHIHSLKSAKPLKDTEIQLIAYNNEILATAKTSETGTAHFDAEVLRGKGGNRPALILAYGADHNFGYLKLAQPAFDFTDRGTGGRKVPQTLDAFLYAERGVYRPGESIRINALLRNNKAIAEADVPLTFQIQRPDGIVVSTQQITGNAQGFYDLIFPLSSSAHTGQWTALVYTDPKKDPIGTLTFSVEDFVPSRLLVSLKSEKTQVAPSEPFAINANAKFLFGSAAGGLNGEGSFLIKQKTNPYPMHQGYQFGLVDEKFEGDRINLGALTLDSNGNTNLDAIIKEAPKTNVPLEVVAQVSIFDKGGRPRLGTLKFDFHTKPFAIGLKGHISENVIPYDATSTEIEIIAVNNEGKLIDAKNLEYQLFAEKIHYNWYQETAYSNWKYKPIKEDNFILKGMLDAKSSESVRLNVPISDWHQYRLEVRDPTTGVMSSYRFEKGYSSHSQDSQSPDQLKVILDKPSYEVGEKVNVHIKAPFDGEAILVVANHSIVETKNIPVSKDGADVSLKAEESWGRGAYVLVSAFRPLGNSENKGENVILPKRAVGVQWAGLSPEAHTLKIGMTIPREVKPRQKIEIPLQIEGATESETFVTVVAVDEGILQLTDYKTPLPHEYFLGKRFLGVEMRDIYGKIIDPIPGEIGVLRSGGDEGALARNLAALSKRAFKIVSLYNGPIALDKSGKTTLAFDIPDFNGTLRIMAVAFNKTKIGGTGESLLVRDPVVSEVVFPRFLAVDDQSHMNLTLFNNTDSEGNYSVHIETEGGVKLVKDEQLNTTLTKDGTWNASIPFQATKIGDAKFNLKVSGNNIETISRSFEISVRSLSSEITNEDAKWLKPGDSFNIDSSLLNNLNEDSNSLTLNASSSLMWNLESILKSLKSYAYGCTEQIISKGFGVLFTPLLSEKKDEEKIKAEIQHVLAVIAQRQNRNGGLSLWQSSVREDAWLIAYGFDFMQRAETLNHPIPKYLYEKAQDWLLDFVKSQLRSNNKSDLTPALYGLYLLTKSGKIDGGIVRHCFDAFFADIKTPLGRAFLANALIRIGDMERASKAFKEIFTIEDQKVSVAYGSSTRDYSAILLLANEAAQLAPTLTEANNIIQMTIKNLGQQTTKEHLSTQEKAWIVLAAGSFSSMKKAESIHLTIGDIEETGINFLTHAISLSDLKAKGIKVTNHGKENVWVNTAASGIPAKPLPAEAKGLNISRKYYTPDGKGLDILKKPITQGEQLIVVINGEISNPTETPPESQLLVVDLLPSCFEIESVSTSAVETKPSEGTSNLSPTPELPWAQLSQANHTEIRDDRFVAALPFDQSTKSFKVAYVIRAVTPGICQHPGLSVEDMFNPRLFARTNHGKVEVVAKS